VTRLARPALPPSGVGPVVRGVLHIGKRVLAGTPVAEGIAVICLLTWWVWPLITAPLLWLRVTVDRLSDFDSNLAPYFAIHRSPGALFWNPFLGFGRPVVGDPLSGVFHPLSLVALVLMDPERGIGPFLLSSLLVTAVTSWWLAKESGCGRAASAVAALVYAASGFVAGHLQAGHIEYLLSLPALPLAWIGGRRLSVLERGGVPLSSVALAIPLLAGSPYFAQFTVVVLVTVVGVRTVTFLIKRRPAAYFPLLFRLVCVGVLAFALSAGHVLPVLLVQSSIVRHPVDPFLGAQSIVTAGLNWLVSPSFYQQLGAARLLEGKETFTFDWWETNAYLGPPLVLLAVGGATLVRSRRVGIVAVEALVVTVVALMWVDDAARWSPFHIIMQALPAALLVRIPTRAIGITTLSLSLLIALAVDAAVRWNRRTHVLANIASITGVVVMMTTTRAPLLKSALQAQALNQPFPVLPEQFQALIITRDIPQSLLVKQGRVARNVYGGWYTTPEWNAPLVFGSVDGWLTRPELPAEIPSGGLRMRDSTAAVPPPPTHDVTGPVLLLPGAPSSHVLVSCTAGPCPPDRDVEFTQEGNMSRLCVRSGQQATYTLPVGAVPGWAARSATGNELPLDASQGLLRVSLPPGPSCAELRYLPPGFVAGAIVSGLTLIGMAIVLWWERRWLVGAKIRPTVTTS